MGGFPYLQGRARDEETVGGLEHAHSLRKLGGLVLEAVGFVDDQVVPGEFGDSPLFEVADLSGVGGWVVGGGWVEEEKGFRTRCWSL